MHFLCVHRHNETKKHRHTRTTVITKTIPTELKETTRTRNSSDGLCWNRLRFFRYRKQLEASKYNIHLRRVQTRLSLKMQPYSRRARWDFKFPISRGVCFKNVSLRSITMVRNFKAHSSWYSPIVPLHFVLLSSSTRSSRKLRVSLRFISTHSLRSRT